MLNDCRIKAIYHYLCESVSNKEIEGLITLLKDYVANGSFIDFEEEDSRVRDIADEIYKLLGF